MPFNSLERTINEKIWNDPSVAVTYGKKQGLQIPEIMALKRIQSELGKIRTILDVGVGGGRTTEYLVGIADRYVGIDYSEEMISLCKKKFSHHRNATFLYCDVRNMSIFDEETFDLVMFSYNGIDNMGAEDREKGLLEMKRVARNNGYILFSSHNVNSIEKLYSFKGWTLSLRELYDHFYHYINIRRVNGSSKKYSHKAMVTLRDGPSKYRLRQMYVLPSEQVEKLTKIGFAEIIVYSLETGKELTSEEITSNEDSWLYYLCTVRK